MNRQLSSVESFLRHDIRDQLSADLAELRIMKEGDLQSCFYFHLRRFLQRDNNWRVYSEKSTPYGNVIDLVLFHRSRKSTTTYVPRIAIELKWRLTRISKKDRESLRQSLHALRVRKAYFFVVNADSDKFVRAKKQRGEKYHLHELVVRLPAGTDYDSWSERRQRIKHISSISRRKTI